MGGRAAVEDGRTQPCPSPASATTGDGTGPGGRLRAAREARGLNLAEVAQTTRIAPAYLAALEEGRGADLPPGAYARAFLRSYATFLGLDAEPLLAATVPAKDPRRPRPCVRRASRRAWPR